MFYFHIIKLANNGKEMQHNTHSATQRNTHNAHNVVQCATQTQKNIHTVHTCIGVGRYFLVCGRNIARIRYVWEVMLFYLLCFS